MAKTILITGTRTGIGYGTAKAFTAAGYCVIATVRKTEDAERLKRELGENLHPVLCDVTHPEQVATLPEQLKRISENGWLDGLINNSGIELIAPAELQNMEEIRAHFETNVFGMIAVTKALLPLLGTDAKAQGTVGEVQAHHAGCVIRARLARSETTLTRRRRLRWLARCAHRSVRDVRRRWLSPRRPSREGP